MSKHVKIRAAVLFALLIGLPSPATAECIGMQDRFKHIRADLIFAGAVTKKEVVSRWDPKEADPVAVGDSDGLEYLRNQLAIGLRITFDVRHVWKGPVQKSLVVYQVLHPDNTDHWKAGTNYVIVADRLSERERSYALRLAPAEEGFSIRGCSTYVYTPSLEKELQRAFGRGRKPE